MKRILSLILALVMCLSLCACAQESSPKTVEDACKQANELLSDLTKEAFAGCTYTGKYDTSMAGGPYYCVSARYFSSLVNSSDYSDYVLVGMTQDIYADVYPKVCKLFEDFDVCVLVTLCDENGQNAYSGIIDGEITYF